MRTLNTTLFWLELKKTYTISEGFEGPFSQYQHNFAIRISRIITLKSDFFVFLLPSKHHSIKIHQYANEQIQPTIHVITYKLP